MSYILNALRKSEQERQAKEGPTLEKRVLGDRETQKPWKTWLVVALIVINLITLSFFIFQSRQESDSKKLPPSKSNADDRAVPAVQLNSGKKNKKSTAEFRKEAIQLADRKKPDKKTPSISESVEKRKSVPIKPAPKPTLEEKVSTLVNVTNEEGLTVLQRSEQTPSSTKPAKNTIDDTADGTQPEQALAEDLSSKDGKPDKNKPSQNPPSDKTTEAPAQTDKKKPVPPPKRRVRKTAKPKIPFFEDLPVEFRRKFPDLNINVYAFSEEPDESFIMVDMVKYVPGQNITEGLELKDIRHESMVVEYEGKKIRIRRP